MKKIQLTIPEPCHENWEKMTAADRGRFCSSCQKTVIDFSTMSDRQLAEFFKKPQGSVCGRFHNDQLNKEIDLSMTRKRIPWVKYFFQFSLPAFLVSMKASAQGRVKLTGDTIICTTSKLGEVAPLPVQEPTAIKRMISGKVVDDKDTPLPYVTIMLKDNKSAATMSDTAGNFRIDAGSMGSSTLFISSVGFESREMVVRDSFVKVVMRPAVFAEMGLLIITPVRRPSKPIPLIKKIMDTAFRKFSVYPNPVPKNSDIKIDMKQIEAGEYTISVIDMAGMVVQTDEVRITEKGQTITYPLKQTAAGTYFIHVFNRRTAASYNEKIIIQ